MRSHASLAALLLAASALGCAAGPTPGTSGLYVLPTFRSGLLCAGWGLVGDFQLHGSTRDPHLTWLTQPDGSRRELVWPEGYRARFEVSLVVFDDKGLVVAAEGSRATGACPMGDAGEWWASFNQ